MASLKEIVNPIFVEATPGSATALTDAEALGKFVVKIQAPAPDDPTSRHTFLFFLDRSDAMQLQKALSDALKGTAS
ncbi:hypothetical protein [Bradyrhizobium sp. USDA 3256]